MWALVITALAAIFVAVTTYMELMRARQLAQIQDELIQAKDKQLGLDLKDKDSKIAEAQKSASEANQRAAEATLASERERSARQPSYAPRHVCAQLDKGLRDVRRDPGNDGLAAHQASRLGNLDKVVRHGRF
jgi:hypothetical protein